MSEVTASKALIANPDELLTKAGGRVDFVFGQERPFAQCHASTLTETPDGDLLCAWFGGTQEKDSDVAIWMARFSGGAWSSPVRVAKVKPVAHWNPVLFTAPDGVVWLFFKVGAEIPQWQTFVMRSPDGGKTWLPAEELVPGDVGGRGPVRNKPIALSDRAWLAPASTEREGQEPGVWQAFVDRTEDAGKTWVRTEYFAVDPAVVSGGGIIQPTLWEVSPGNVRAFMRSTGGIIARSDSADGGNTWSPVRASGLPNNNSGIDAVKLADGRVFLVYNPVAENWGPRTPLTLAKSEDNGETWSTVTNLEDDEQRFREYNKLIQGEETHQENALGEYSYPAIIRTKRGIAISYTWRRDRIRCWQIPLEALA